MKNRLFFDIKPDDSVFDKIVEEQRNIGYYSLPEQNIDYIKKYKNEFESKTEDIRHIVVIGIGGSSLGTKAIYEVMKNSKKLKRDIEFLESTDPVAIKNKVKKIDLEKSHFFVVSKSGTTVETISIYKYILNLLQNKNISEDYRFTYITDKASMLESHAKTKKSFCLHVNKNVGGRFSVLSAVGLAPLFLTGVDIKELLEGAKNIKRSFFENGYIKDILLKKATYYAKNSMRYNINALFIYSEIFEKFGEWYVQLWGESLGKKQLHSSFNVGLTPISLIGPKDQHSFLQLIIEGLRDKSVTFLKIENLNSDLNIPDNTLKGLETLDIINNLSFNSLINLQADSVIDSLLSKKDIPLDLITLKKIDEYSIGQFIYYFELLTSLVAKLMGIDAYNQPGVEQSKKMLLTKIKEIE